MARVTFGEAKRGDPERGVQDLVDTVKTAWRKLSVAGSAANIVAREQPGRGAAVTRIMKHLKQADILVGKAVREAEDLARGTSRK